MVDVANGADWRTEVNIVRETWGFVHVQTTSLDAEQNERRVDSIETGVGNSNTLLRSNQVQVSDFDHEKQLLERFKTYIDSFRPDGSTLITPDIRTIRVLRTRLLENNITVSFRGLRHIPLKEVYTEYFTYGDEDVRFDSYQDIDGEIASDDTAVESMWAAYKKAGPYLPPKGACGRKL